VHELSVSVDEPKVSHYKDVFHINLMSDWKKLLHFPW